MDFGTKLLVTGLLLVLVGVANGGWLSIVSWLGACFSVLGFAHFVNGSRVLGKRSDGRIAWWSWLLFLPLHGFSHGVWHCVRLTSRIPVTSRVDDELVIGRRLLAHEHREQFANFIDLTSEFSEPRDIRRSAPYLSFPILDAGAPSPTALLAFLKTLRPGGSFVHCAQGRGRTGLFAAALLFHTGRATTTSGALSALRTARPGIHLNPVQLKCLEEFAAMQALRGPGED